MFPHFSPCAHHASLPKNVFAVGDPNKQSAAHTYIIDCGVPKARARCVPPTGERPEGACCLLERHCPVYCIPNLGPRGYRDKRTRIIQGVWLEDSVWSGEDGR